MCKKEDKISYNNAPGKDFQILLKQKNIIDGNNNNNNKIDKSQEEIERCDMDCEDDDNKDNNSEKKPVTQDEKEIKNEKGSANMTDLIKIIREAFAAQKEVMEEAHNKQKKVMEEAHNKQMQIFDNVLSKLDSFNESIGNNIQEKKEEINSQKIPALFKEKEKNNIDDNNKGSA